MQCRCNLQTRIAIFIITQKRYLEKSIISRQQGHFVLRNYWVFGFFFRELERLQTAPTGPGYPKT